MTDRTQTDRAIFASLVEIGLSDRDSLMGYSLVDVLGDYDESEPSAVACQLIHEDLMATLTFECDDGLAYVEDVIAEDLWRAAETLLEITNGTYENTAVQVAEVVRAANQGIEAAQIFCQDVVHTAVFGL